MSIASAEISNLLLLERSDRSVGINTRLVTNNRIQPTCEFQCCDDSAMIVEHNLHQCANQSECNRLMCEDCYDSTLRECDPVARNASHVDDEATHEALINHTGHDINDCMEELECDIVFDTSREFDRYSYYSPIKVHQNLQCYKDRSHIHYVGGIKTSWNIPAWEYELSFESDLLLRSYLNYAVKNGVLIVDQDAVVPTYECPYYLSATAKPALAFLNELIHKEINQNHLVLAVCTPHCIHAIGAVPKMDGGWRPITDCRRLLGYSFYNCMETIFREFSFSTMDDVCGLLTQECYMATVDIKAAYHTVTVSPDHWKYQGLRWPVNGHDSYIMDTSLCFGLKCAPNVFNQFSNFVRRCLHRRGFVAVISYLDDYWVKGESFEECQSVQMKLIEILGSLGFVVSFKKCSSPSTKTT